MTEQGGAGSRNLGCNCATAASSHFSGRVFGLEGFNCKIVCQDAAAAAAEDKNDVVATTTEAASPTVKFWPKPWSPTTERAATEKPKVKYWPKPVGNVNRSLPGETKAISSQLSCQRELPDMMSELEGGGGSWKADMVREVA